MANGKDRNYISFWFWFWAMLVMALPCINVIMIVIWALVGENESRKNYFKALIVWFLIWTIVSAGVLLLGLWPVVEKRMQNWPP